MSVTSPYAISMRSQHAQLAQPPHRVAAAARRQPDDAISLREQQLREIRTVLPGYAGDERGLSQVGSFDPVVQHIGKRGGKRNGSRPSRIRCDLADVRDRAPLLVGAQSGGIDDDIGPYTGDRQQGVQHVRQTGFTSGSDVVDLARPAVFQQ